MQKNTNPLKTCIEACQRCYAVCTETALHHCIETGGEHTEPKHFRLMVACAEVCRTTAALMLMGYERHRLQCGICADICEECAQDCERVGDMDACVAACRACVRECRAMASHAEAA